MADLQRFDVIVVGSGGSGTSAAREAASAGARVLLVSKDPLVCSDSKISEGVVTVRGSGSPKDTQRHLANNMRIQGDDLAEPSIVEAFAADSQEAYSWLRREGIRPPLDEATGNPESLPLPLGGHDLRRSVGHANGGLDYGHALMQALLRDKRIVIWEDSWFLDVVQDSNRAVLGGLIYRAAEARLETVVAASVVLACGGASTLYFPDTDTMRGNTGDGYAIAGRAGAALVDMEQVQFLPFGLAYPPSHRGILAGEPVTAGPLGVLRDRDGKKILGELMVRTRAELAAAIAKTIADGRGTEHGACFLDLTANARGAAGKGFVNLMKKRIPTILRSVRGALGREAAEYKIPWEVKPSAHYFMGGVLVDADGRCLAFADGKRTPIPGLFAAGQVMGGLHGSNRLGSTSLAEAVIFGRRTGRVSADYAATVKATDDEAFHAAASVKLHQYRSVLGRAGEESAPALTKVLQTICREMIGPAREGDGLKKALAQIDSIECRAANVEIPRGLAWNQEWLDCIELDNMLHVARAVALSCLERDRSLGAHVRLDGGSSGGKPYSVTAILGESGHWQVIREARPATPVFARAAMRFRQALRIFALRLLAKMPNRMRDPLLARAYKRWTGSAKDSEPARTKRRREKAA